ncbi:MAG: hypothetical protein EAZ51_01000 [Sphingobacteriales bacterium]|nr:MAG: hypothetical protein EAZ64_01530 [Sphingobacteriales bacterium]TAF83130.1 MAG: hypothetical protein EAZ51_01000 [Sphingobacteriales bacterium]
MKKFVFVILFIGSFLLCKAQTDSTKISLNKPITLHGNIWKGVKYSYGGSNNVDIRKIRTMLNIDNQNTVLLKQAQNAKLISRITAVVGGICVGFGLNSYLSQADFNVPLVVSGAALIGVSLPLSSLSVSKMKKAVGRYNTK